MDILAAQVGELLKSHGLMLVTAESCTGGGVAQAITDIAGSSVWFERGFVTYSNLSKQEMLGVPAATLVQHGAVSEATVRAMATGALAYSRGDIAVAVSGIAGPGGGSADKPVGTVWFAWAVRQGEVRVAHHLLTGDRTAVRFQSVRHALNGVLESLKNCTKLA